MNFGTNFGTNFLFGTNFGTTSPANDSNIIKVKHSKQDLDTPLFDLLLPNSMEEDTNKLENYILQNKIGSGAFGKVYRVKNKTNNIIYAAKISISAIDDSTKDLLDDISREINIISKLNHPSVLKFILYSEKNFKGKPKPVIITEFASNGALSDLISHDIDNPDDEPILTDTRKLIIIYGIAAAMAYLHSNGVLHRDLKPDNVLIDDYLFPKVADFGLSKENKDSANSKTMAGNVKGTPVYIAPEIWEKTVYDKPGDVYAFAIVLFEIMTMTRPFPGANFFQLCAMVPSGVRPEFTKEIPKVYKDLIERCWDQEPLKRPTFDEIVSEIKTKKEFITENVNKREFTNYINYISSSRISFDSSKKIVVMRNKSDSSRLNSAILLKHFPVRYYNLLGEKTRKFVEEAEAGDVKQKVQVGKCLIEGKYDFQIDVQVGLVFIKLAIKQGSKDAMVYYIDMLLKGEVIPQNFEKIQKTVEKNFANDDGLCSYAYGKIYKKKKKYSKARECFLKAMRARNIDSFYEYAEMLRKGLAVPEYREEMDEFYTKALREGNQKAMLKYGIYLKDNSKYRKKEGIRLIKKAADERYPKASYYYGKLLEKSRSNKEEPKVYFEKAAEEGCIELVDKHAVELVRSNSDTKDKDLQKKIILLLNKACYRGCFESMFEYGKLLFEGKFGLRKNQGKGLNYIKIAADNKCIDASFYYGKLLNEGIKVDRNVRLARNFVRFAADNGNPSAMNYYALMMSNSNNDYESNEAETYFKQAIDKGRIEALNDYGFYLLNRKDNHDYQEIIRLFKMAIDKGNSDAMINYANMLMNGTGVEVDLKKAFQLYKAAIDTGNTRALNQYGILLRKGICVEADDKEALKYFKMAAERGSADGMNNYAYMLANGIGTDANYEEAIRYFKMAIAEKNALAMNNYACILIRGLGTDVNFDEANKYLKMAMDEKSPPAYVNYAHLNKDNPAFKENKASLSQTGNISSFYEEAINKGSLCAINEYAHWNYCKENPSLGEIQQLYEKSIAKGFAPSMNNYATMLQKGIGFKKDKLKAVELYKMAIKKNNLKAMLNYGLMLIEYSSSQKEGLDYILKSANGGDPDALYQYGLILEEGYLVEQDKEEAIEYYKKASEKGQANAKEKLKRFDGTYKVIEEE